MSTKSGGLEGEMTQPPGGGKPPYPDPSVLKNVSDQSSATSIGMGGRIGDKKEMRTFAQILADEKQKRNILEIKLRKLSNNDQLSVKSLTVEDVSVLLFDVIKLDPSHCLGVALRTSRFDTKEVKLKPEMMPPNT